jgi:hypothetical protein
MVGLPLCATCQFGQGFTRAAPLSLAEYQNPDTQLGSKETSFQF